MAERGYRGGGSRHEVRPPLGALEAETARELTLVRYAADLLDNDKRVPNASWGKLHAVFAEMRPSQLRDLVIQAYLPEWSAWNQSRPVSQDELVEQARAVLASGGAASMDFAENVLRYFDQECQ